MSDDKAKNAQRLRGMLRAYDRTPFLDMLQALLEAQPDPEVLKEFARKSPDKFMQATKIAAGLGGFQEASTIDLNLRRPEDLSDMELEARIRAQFAEMQAHGFKLLPAGADPDDPEETT